MIRVSAFLAALGLALGAGSCGVRQASAVAAEGPQEGLPMGKVVLLSPTGPDVTVHVQIAHTDEQREKGLMFVRSLPADAGMIFVFDHDGPQTFWMKNTYIPLDMIFIDHALEVVGVVADAAPLTLDPRTPGVPAKYVLEVNAGFAARWGITPGTTVRFIDVPTDP